MQELIEIVVSKTEYSSRREISLETLTSVLRTSSKLECQDENSGFGDEVIDIKCRGRGTRLESVSRWQRSKK